MQEAAGSLQGVLFANNGETRGNAVKNYRKNMVVVYLKASQVTRINKRHTKMFLNEIRFINAVSVAVIFT
ncbi:hypothetical protein KPRYC492_12540 [Klebsiella pneumoniae RYC492]|nr:hypothetical protein KPRYC492_12540 [Klebsiella pneumoniae RYC492]